LFIPELFDFFGVFKVKFGKEEAILENNLKTRQKWKGIFKTSFRKTTLKLNILLFIFPRV